MRVLFGCVSSVFLLAFVNAALVPVSYVSTAPVHLAAGEHHSYEYTSSVQTGDYTNYASVKSDNLALPHSAPIVAVRSVVPAVPTTTIITAPHHHQVHYVAAAPAAAVPLSIAAHSIVVAKTQQEPAPIVEEQSENAEHVEAAEVAADDAAISPPTIPAIPAIPTLPEIPAIVTPAIPTPVIVAQPPTLAAVPIIPTVAATKTQYHSQDSLGQAVYGHTEALQAHTAVQDAAGNKIGSYSYVAPDGRLLTTDYVADANGYRVTTNALPQDDAHAAVHLLRKRRALVGLSTLSTVPVVKEATVVEQPGHSSTVRLDTYNANVLTHQHVPAVVTNTYAYAAHPLSYSYVY